MPVPRVVTAVTGTGAAYLLLARAWDQWARPEEIRAPLPGDDLVLHATWEATKAITIGAPPEAVWPWLPQIGDHRAGFYSCDRVERFTFPGTVHYIEGTHSATRIHPELQHVRPEDPINTASIGNPVTVIEPGHALVIGTWAFVLLQPMPGRRTRLLVRDRDCGYLRAAAPARAAAGSVSSGAWQRLTSSLSMARPRYRVACGARR